MKTYGLVQKTCNPNRVPTPMKRTSPKKGRNEDAGFVPICIDPESTPAGVNVCFEKAFSFVDLDDPHSNVSQLLVENRHLPMHDERSSTC